MPRWQIRGFEGGCETGLDEVASGSERQIRTLLQRLAARHLTDREIIDAVESDAHFNINSDKRPGEPTQLSTTGTDHHYTATRR
jgi:hypothetical protein